MKILILMIKKMLIEGVIPTFIILIGIQFLVYRIFKFSIFNYIINEIKKYSK